MDEQVGDHEPGDCLPGHAPELLDRAFEVGGVLECGGHGRLDLGPVLTWGGAGTERAATQALPMHGVVDKVTNGPAVAGRCCVPVVITDVSDRVVPFLGRKVPDVSRSAHAVLSSKVVVRAA